VLTGGDGLADDQRQIAADGEHALTVSRKDSPRSTRLVRTASLFAARSSATPATRYRSGPRLEPARSLPAMYVTSIRHTFTALSCHGRCTDATKRATTERDDSSITGPGLLP